MGAINGTGDRIAISALAALIATLANAAGSTHAAANTGTAGATVHGKHTIFNVDCARTLGIGAIQAAFAAIAAIAANRATNKLVVDIAFSIWCFCTACGSSSVFGGRANTGLAADARAAIAAGDGQLTGALTVLRCVDGQRCTVRHMDTGGHAVVGRVRDSRRAGNGVSRAIRNNQCQLRTALHLDRGGIRGHRNALQIECYLR